MPSSSVKAAETTSYSAVRATPFTQIHGRPTRQDYELLKKEASDLASEVENITFAWSRDTATGEEYGLLAEIIGDVEYTHLTNLNWAQETEPVHTIPQSLQLQQRIQGREWKKNGTRNALHGSSGKDSFAQSQ